MSSSRALETQSNQNKSSSATSSLRASSRVKEPSSSSFKPSKRKDLPSNGLTLEEKTLAINLGPNISDFLRLKKEFDRASSSQRREVLLSSSTKDDKKRTGREKEETQEMLYRRAVWEGLDRLEDKVQQSGGMKGDAVVGELGRMGADEERGMVNVEERFAVLEKLDGYARATEIEKKKLRKEQKPLSASSVFDVLSILGSLGGPVPVPGDDVIPYVNPDRSTTSLMTELTFEPRVKGRVEYAREEVDFYNKLVPLFGSYGIVIPRLRDSASSAKGAYVLNVDLPSNTDLRPFELLLSSLSEKTFERLFEKRISKKAEAAGSPEVKWKLTEISFSTDGVKILGPFRPAILLNFGGFLATTEEQTIGVFFDLATLVLRKPQALSRSLVDHLTSTLGRSPSEEELLAFVKTVESKNAEQGLLLKLSSRAIGQGRCLLAIIFLHARFKLQDTRYNGAGWESCGPLIEADKVKAAVNA